jgi:hypothetical protein
MCAQATQVCVGLPALGGDCTLTSYCADGTQCVGTTTRTCVRLTAGQDCTALNNGGGGTCSDGSYCVGTTPPRCTFGTVAAGGTCSYYSGTGSTASTLCAPVPGEGWSGCQYDGTSYTCVANLYSCY